MSAGVPSISSLIPHRGRSLFVDQIVELHEDGIDCRGRIPPTAALARDGQVPSFVGLEVAAQAAAAYEALRRTGSGGPRAGPRIGYVVTLRNVQLERPGLPLDTPLSVSVRSEGGAATLALYRARVLCRGKLCVQGTIGTYLPPDEGREEGGRS